MAEPSQAESPVNDYAALLGSLQQLAEFILELQALAVRQYTPVVESILRSGSRDVRPIEQVLSGLLDFCSYEPALLLYKRLCRYYFDIDPIATVDYVYAYRDLWDSATEAQP